MAIPDYESLMLPMLRLSGDGVDRSMREVRETLAREFRLTEDELAEKLPSGQTSVWANRVGWAKTYLHQAGLLALVRRGVIQSTPRGRE